MGYTTDFSGQFNFNKPLGQKMATYLKLFSETRRMNRNVDEAFGVEGEFYVFGEGFAGQAHENNIVDYNQQPITQPGLWCQWEPNEDGTALVWNEAEKFYSYTEWLVYLIHKILAPNGYVLNGTVQWQGEENGDVGEIRVEDNRVFTKEWKGKKTEWTPEVCTSYSYGRGETKDFMRTDVVFLLEEDGKQLGSNEVLALPVATSTYQNGWIDNLLPIIEEYKDGSDEALDGDDVDRLCEIIKAKINLQEGNITEDEYNKILG